jgi:hypothetical protein
MNSARAAGGDREEAQRLRRPPAVPRAADDRVRERAHRGDEQELSGQVERAGPLVARLLHEAPRQDEHREPDGDVDEEDDPPSGALDEKPAEGRADREGRRSDRRPDADRPRLCFGSGNAAETSASDVTFTVAAATPWTARARLRTPSDGARPHAIDAAVKRAMPMR